MGLSFPPICIYPLIFRAILLLALLFSFLLFAISLRLLFPLLPLWGFRLLHLFLLFLLCPSCLLLLLRQFLPLPLLLPFPWLLRVSASLPPPLRIPSLMLLPLLLQRLFWFSSSSSSLVSLLWFCSAFQFLSLCFCGSSFFFFY